MNNETTNDHLRRTIGRGSRKRYRNKHGAIFTVTGASEQSVVLAGVTVRLLVVEMLDADDYQVGVPFDGFAANFEYVGPAL